MFREIKRFLTQLMVATKKKAPAAPAGEVTLEALKAYKILGRAQVAFRYEPYKGAPEPDMDPYDRIQYHYGITAERIEHIYADLGHRVESLPFAGKNAKFGRDEKFKTLDFI